MNGHDTMRGRPHRGSSTTARNVWAGRRPAAAIILLGYIATLIANFPGHFPPDALWQLAQGRAGRYNLWHPPIMAWLLGLADRVHPGAWLFVVFNGALFYGALFALVALERRPRWICLPLLALSLASPVVLIYQGVVLKDVLFANAALAGFAALAWAERLSGAPLRRLGLLGAALVLFTLAMLTRQNGVLVPVCAAIALGVMRLTGRPAGQRLKQLSSAFTVGVAALALVCGFATMASAFLQARSDGRPENENHLKVLQIYDLAGEAHLEPGLPLPLLRRRAPRLEWFLRHEAAPSYRPAGVDNLFTLPGAAAMMTPPGGALGDQWSAVMVNDPGLYLRTRAKVLAITVGTPATAACPMVITGVDAGDPALLRRAGLSARDNAKDDWDSDYAMAFLGTPVFSHTFYSVLAIAALAWSLLR